MKILILGGITDYNLDEDSIKNQKLSLSIIIEKLSGDLLDNGHEILVCSPFDDSADFYAITHFKTVKQIHQNKLHIYYPETSEIKEKLENVLKTNSIKNAKKFPCKFVPTDKNENNNQYSWLVAQISALDASSGVILVGGKNSGALNLLLKIAESKNKTILPISYIGGAAELYLNENQWIIRDIIPDDFSSLKKETGIAKIPSIFDQLSIGKPKNQSPKFFISYPRLRPQEADYIETLLRRRGYAVYRDEETFEPSAETPSEIMRCIKDASVFIAIWCKEYACSPWCFDELELGVQRFQEGISDLWIFCVDDTRIVPKSARNLNYFQVETRDKLESKTLFLLNKTK